MKHFEGVGTSAGNLLVPLDYAGHLGGQKALVKELRCFVNTHSVVAKLVSAQCAPSHRKCLLFLIHRGPVIKRDPNKLRMKMNFK